MIFNKNHNGAEELHRLIGFIDADSHFYKWRTYLELSKRRVIAFIGNEVYNEAKKHYDSQEYKDEGTSIPDRLVHKIQLPIAYFAFVKIIPSLDVQHSNAGRKRNIGDAEKPISLAEAYKDEANILSLAYEAVDDLLAFLFNEKLDVWINSAICKNIRSLLVPDLVTFDQYYVIGSYRLFVTLSPLLREVQEREILPRLTQKHYTKLLSSIGSTENDTTADTLLGILPSIRRAMVLSAMAKGLERLPVELLPEGIVQTRIIGTVKEKLVADDKIRREVAAVLYKDAATDLEAVATTIASLDEAKTGNNYISRPHAVPGGFTI